MAVITMLPRRHTGTEVDNGALVGIAGHQGSLALHTGRLSAV